MDWKWENLAPRPQKSLTQPWPQQTKQQTITLITTKQTWLNNRWTKTIDNIPGGGGVLPEKSGGGVRPASQIPYPIYDQNLRFSLPYLWPIQKFDTPFMTWP